MISEVCTPRPVIRKHVAVMLRHPEEIKRDYRKVEVPEIYPEMKEYVRPKFTIEPGPGQLTEIPLHRRWRLCSIDSCPEGGVEYGFYREVA